jgi:hypothetical protein
MDYDKTAIAATYDAARSYRPEVMGRWLELIAAHVPSRLDVIVDVGCGTGRFTHPLAERFAARECRRVLRADGRICIRNTTRDSVYPHPRFFPGFQAIVASELPSRDEVVALFEGTGLRLCAHEVVPHPVAASWQELADKLALRADSFIVRLPAAEFEAGMAALRAHAANSDASEEITQHIDFFVFGA